MPFLGRYPCADHFIVFGIIHVSQSLAQYIQAGVRQGYGAVQRRKARTGRNPQTGEPLKIKAKSFVKFKAGKNLKESI